MGSNKKNKKSKNKNEKSKGSDENLITDSRFSSVHWDPRFQNVPKHKAKVEIDSRFDRMFSDKRFGSSSVPLDKRGKPKKLDQGNSLRHYYKIEEDEDKVNSEVKKKEKKIEEEEEEESEELEELGGEESEDDVATGDSDTTTDTDTDDEYEEEEGVFEDGEPVRQAEDVPEIDKETHRLAIVNLDWRHVKAVDLYAVLRSFLPKDGEMKSVAVYPSEFGLQRMKEEELHGPVGLFDDENEKSDEDEDDDDDELDAQKLRAYEKSKLRYYYAVVECDSSATADYLYKNCDGVEFERSSNKLDLRFIPDSMEFQHPPRDVATEVPANYVGLDFQTQALQQSKIYISWDEDDPGRKTLKRKFTDDQLSELELKEFLASDESESDEDENDDATEDKSDKKSKKRDMYRTLILSGNGEGDASDGDGEGEDDDKDMEITFNTGLEDISKRIQEQRDKESETVWEAYLRKRREKKKARKNRSKDSSEDESSDTDREATEDADDFFIEEPSVKKSKKGSQGKGKKGDKQNQDTDREAEASRNELELLLADDKGADTGLKGYNLKRKKTKGKKGKEVQEEDNIPAVDYEDPRFSALFMSPRFALDPTDPQFKRSAAYARQLALRQQQGDQEKVVEREVKSDVLRSKIEKSSLIRSIKMKAKPFDGKMSKKEENLQSKGKKEKKDKREAPSLVEPVKKKKKTKA
ncbi:pre-rRNA-processing protein esf1 isoform X2 [Prunus avium]|uniref:Pre-rRNA-processing protein esf1 isoform X2 n=1 Tax=Prunus avium TaxID=42229 RepID=A0A6P5SHA6_PRUAV|nr:pre-rRNA-processing protein esf1 isoform X2 [Prunus avium]